MSHFGILIDAACLVEFGMGITHLALSDSLITKGSSRGATLSFTLRSKGEGGQPRYLILQEIASHFSTPPHPCFCFDLIPT